MPVKSSINPGKLDTLLTFYSASDGANAIGGISTTWATQYRQMYGNVQWGASPERIEANQVVGSNNVTVTVRIDTGILNTMRFKMNSETTYFYVQDVRHWQREGYSIIIAERRDNQ